MAGLVIQGSDINISAGDICRSLTTTLRRAASIKRFTDRFTSAQLVTAFGGTTGEWDIVKSAIGEMATTTATFQTNRAFVDQLAGLGDI